MGQWIGGKAHDFPIQRDVYAHMGQSRQEARIERLDTARIDAASWTLPPLFQWLKDAGNVDAQEMYRVFNCGIGMAVIVAAADADAAQAKLAEAGETVFRIGRIDTRGAAEAPTIVG